MKVQKIPANQRLKILLTNGRFPVALDLARQLKKVGHSVYTVDPMHFNITKFSRSVKKCYEVPAPHVSAQGYVEAVCLAVRQLRIQLVIPLHEEILYLAQVDELRPYLFAPSYHTLLALHNKWSFWQLTVAAGLTAPPSILCKTMADFQQLDLANKEYALKPVFGRALSGIHHHKPGQPLPDDLGVSEELPYIAQEWIHGKQLCSYAVARNGQIKAAAVYPVIDTIDGSSCVFFESVENLKIKHFMDTIAATYNVTGQMAFDFIETPEGLYALECNPRATSGIHLFNGTSWLVDAFCNPYAPRVDARIGMKMQMVPGMLMWDKNDKNRKEKTAHAKRLLSTHDTLFRGQDPLPFLMQPFLYVTYIKRCHENNLVLKELFQWDVIWEPTRESIQRACRQAIMVNDRVTWAAYGLNSGLSLPAPTQEYYYTTPAYQAQPPLQYMIGGNYDRTYTAIPAPAPTVISGSRQMDSLLPFVTSPTFISPSFSSANDAVETNLVLPFEGMLTTNNDSKPVDPINLVKTVDPMMIPNIPSAVIAQAQ